MFRSFLITVIFAISLLPSALRAETITVFAAASMKTAMDEIAQAFTVETGHEVRFSYAGSSALARQIEHGAPADIFISASTDWMDALEVKGLIEADTRFPLASNRLVLISRAPRKIIFNMYSDQAVISEMVGEEHLATALTEAVPLGIYAKQALTARGEWEKLSPRIVQADNARAALELVASGAAKFGIVYSSDARAEPRVSAIASFPAESHDPIMYPVAALKDRKTEAVTAFLSFLKSEKAREALTAQGFGLPQ